VNINWVWIWPIICALFPLFADLVQRQAYGPAGMWCWIMPTNVGTIFRYIFFYGPLLLSSIVATICYFITCCSNPQRGCGGTASRNTMCCRYSSFCLIVIVCLLPPFIDRLYETITGNLSLVLLVLHSLTYPLFGVITYNYVYLQEKDSRRREKVKNNNSNARNDGATVQTRNTVALPGLGVFRDVDDDDDDDDDVEATVPPRVAPDHDDEPTSGVEVSNDVILLENEQ